MSFLIETARLGMRHFTLDDIEDYFELGSDPDIIKYAQDRPMADHAEARRVMLDAPLTDYRKYGYGRYAVIYLQTGELIGFCGMKYMPELDMNELGYRYKRRFWGQGIGTEAGDAMLEHAHADLGLDEAVALILEENIGSIRVAEKLGLHLDGRVKFDNHMPLLYRTALPRPARRSR